MKTKGAVGEVCALLRIWSLISYLIANYCMRWHGIFKGLSRDGEHADFSLKKHRASLFNDVLSSKPYFDRIHLAGQYL
jgi:hypothetical protein